jgi:rod shape-determining protein MreC
MRELFNRYRFFFLAVALLLSTLLLYSYNLRNKGATSFFERAILTIAAPFQASLDDSADFIKSLWGDYVWLIDARRQNRELLQENRQLRAELQQGEEIRLQNERLRNLLDFIDDVDRAALPAQVIGEDASSWARTVTLDKGSRSGLRDGLPVVAAGGVVGRIIKTASDSSRVLLVTDASSNVAALVQRTRSRGILQGSGAQLTLKFVLRNADVAVGDLLVTSGMGGVFPKGLSLGKVAVAERDDLALFQKIQVAPVVDFSHLEEVMVLMGEDR